MKESREIVTTTTTTESRDIERPFEPPYAVPAGNGNYPMYRGAATQEGFQVLDYWRAIRKRLWLVLGIAVLATTLAAIYMARKPDIYEAKARVQVDSEQANPALTTSDRPLLPNSDPAYFNTQLQLLTSDLLLRRVIKEMNLDTNKDFQIARGDDSVSPWRAMLRAIGLASKNEKKNDKEIDEVTVGNSLASTEDIKEAIRLAPYVDIIKKKIRIEPIRESRATFKDTRLIEINFQHTDPELAALIVNGIGEVFTKINQEKRTGKNKETSGFLNDRIASLQAEIKNDELKLAQLQREAGIIKSDEGGKTIVIDRLAGLNKNLLDAENKRKNAEAEYSAVKGSPEKINAMAEDKLGRFYQEQETAMRTLTNETTKQIANLEAEKAKLMEEYQENQPEVQEYVRRINTLKAVIEKAQEKNRKDLEEYRSRSARDILTQLQTKFEQTKAEEDKIRADFNKQFNEAQGENQSAINIRLLEQTIETNRGFLENLQKNQSTNDLQATGTENNISVVDWAIPPDAPISPRRLMTVLAALFLSTLFGAGLALFLEYLDDTIKSTEEVENYLQLPALAAIPTIDSLPKRKLLLVGSNEEAAEAAAKTELLIHTDSRSSLAEAYRQLRTSILLSTAGHAPKSLLITSSLPSEGKTTTAVNTAISLAQTGASVLIIDSDMRRPRLHSVFNISNAEGLSTILSSDLNEKEILDIVQYDEDAKMYLLPSGPVPPNPAELIGSEQMSNLLKVMQKSFTHVVVDSPPIASFTDGVLIASMVDGVILVVHSGKSSRQVVRRSRQLLQDIGAKIFGVVLNNVNLRSQDNYYYYQSYYHRDNYRHDEEQ